MENSNLSYKELHEKFMQNHTGTSVEETVLILTPAPIAIFLSAFIVKYVGSFVFKKTFFSSFVLFILEFFVLVVTQILLFVFPTAPNIFIFITLCFAATCLAISIVLKFIHETVAHEESIVSVLKIPLVGKRPYITYFRSSVNLITTICILGVDFTSFPRKFAKTEIYGFSLMDTGVGFFVVCNALVGHHLFSHAVHKGTRLNLFKQQLKQNSVLIFLGLLRVISTKSIDYQTHNSEYGVHWNFFITLALTRLIAVFILTFVSIKTLKFLAFMVVMIHQFALYLGLEDWVASNAPRDNIITANREGIISLLGYIGLYLVAVEVGNKLNLKSTTFESDAKLILKLVGNVLLLYFLLTITHKYFQCSRRLANVTYILFIVMLTLYLLTLCLLFELLLRLHNGPKNVKDDSNVVPSILLSINFNALLYFLLCNLSTGIVNLSIETLHVAQVSSILILIIYMFLNCSIVKILFHKAIKLF